MISRTIYRPRRKSVRLEPAHEEAILDAWDRGLPSPEIVTLLKKQGVHVDGGKVNRVIKKHRENGDPRARYRAPHSNANYVRAS